MKLLEVEDYFLVKNGSTIYEFEVINTLGEIQVRLVRKFNGEELESIKKMENKLSKTRQAPTKKRPV